MLALFYPLFTGHTDQQSGPPSCRTGTVWAGPFEESLSTIAQCCTRGEQVSAVFHLITVMSSFMKAWSTCHWLGAQLESRCLAATDSPREAGRHQNIQPGGQSLCWFAEKQIVHAKVHCQGRCLILLAGSVVLHGCMAASQQCRGVVLHRLVCIDCQTSAGMRRQVTVSSG